MDGRISEREFVEFELGHQQSTATTASNARDQFAGVGKPGKALFKANMTTNAAGAALLYRYGNRATAKGRVG
ncbi:hypothetical protein A1355_03245 [Methylomonas koyamae]|uniref:Uncharacterized protein n=1 Tax=Methylomonas koyamae TaxID=702114 RepID=A0A177NPH8_9GAMM|nr:hypothetical protein A1355_03245 [Methylomonas koyamae]